MKLYINQTISLKVFSINYTIPIKDEAENERYYIQYDKRKKLGYNFLIYDSDRKEIAFIRQIRFLRPKLEIYIKDLLYTTITRKYLFSFPYLLFTFEGTDLTVKGNFNTNYEYVIKNRFDVIASIKKCSLGLDYEIEVADKTDAGLIIALFWAIDSFMSAG